MRSVVVPCLLVVCVSTACASGGVAAPTAPSAVELRALQTRSYDDVKPQAALKALLDTLQDEGFQVSRTEPELGLIVAEKHAVSNPGAGQRLARVSMAVMTYGAALLLPWPQYHHLVLEATANVTPAGDGVKVRLGLQYRELDKAGRLERTRTVADGSAYQAMFTRLDKSLYLLREGLD